MQTNIPQATFRTAHAHQVASAYAKSMSLQKLNLPASDVANVILLAEEKIVISPTLLDKGIQYLKPYLSLKNAVIITSVSIVAYGSFRGGKFVYRKTNDLYTSAGRLMEEARYYLNPERREEDRRIRNAQEDQANNADQRAQLGNAHNELAPLILNNNDLIQKDQNQDQRLDNLENNLLNKKNEALELENTILKSELGATKEELNTTKKSLEKANKKNQKLSRKVKNLEINLEEVNAKLTNIMNHFQIK